MIHIMLYLTLSGIALWGHRLICLYGRTGISIAYFWKSDYQWKFLRDALRLRLGTTPRQVILIPITWYPDTIISFAHPSSPPTTCKPYLSSILSICSWQALKASVRLQVCVSQFLSQCLSVLKQVVCQRKFFLWQVKYKIVDALKSAKKLIIFDQNALVFANLHSFLHNFCTFRLYS